MTFRATPPEREHRPHPDSAPNDGASLHAVPRSEPESDALTPQQPAAPQPLTPRQPLTRREARELAAAAQSATPARTPMPIPAPAPAQAAGPAPEPEPEAAHPDLAWLHTATHGHGGGDGGRPPKPPRRGGGGRRATIWIVSTLVILGLIGGGALFAWDTFQPQVKSVLNHFNGSATDYKGDGTGTVDITINQGDTGATIATTLTKAGVTMTSQAFYQLLLATKPDPVFQPGVYQLRKHMSAASALALLQNPKSRLERTLLIREGAREATILQDAATATGIPLAQLKAAAADPSHYGLPAQAKTLEGFLFPATYTFNPGVTADQVITQLVDRAKQAFQADGIPSDKLWNTLILASVVQAEAGPNPQDLPKIAGVFTNRIAQQMPLQSDATVAYGAGQFNTVWTTPTQRADASNPYNTYLHLGLPPGPIGNPGDAALTAALHPEGDYLYFTVVNLKTGETAFSNTNAEQDANVAKLQAWCAQAANASYCK